MATHREDLTRLDGIFLPWLINTTTDSSVHLHGFSDASKLAMSAVIYITTQSSEGKIVSTLLCSKTKVAPLQRLSIPGLELTAALLLRKLAQYVHKFIQVNIAEIHLWTDSRDSLPWINSHPSRWKDFVRNRVMQIQELVPSATWRHVPGISNPVDCASRGLATSQLMKHSLWWTGPSWLLQSSDSWPAQSKISSTLGEVASRPGLSLNVSIKRTGYHWDLIERFSLLHELYKVTALCLRFIHLYRKTLSSSLEYLNKAKLF